MPKRIILVRHGESKANVDSRVYANVPDWRIELTENGVAQALAAGQKIAGLIGDESFGVFVSPYKRTLQTRDSLLEGIGRKPVYNYQDPELREQEFGNMPPKEENDKRIALRREFGYFFYRFPEGESCADVYDRMALFLDTLYRRFNSPSCPENIIIVSHGNAIKCFLARWYHWTVDYFDSLGHLPNCHITVMTNAEPSQTSTRFIFELSEPFGQESIFH